MKALLKQARRALTYRILNTISLYVLAALFTIGPITYMFLDSKSTTSRTEGLQLLAEGEHKKGLSVLEKALGQDPIDIEVTLHSAIAYYHLNNYTAARELLDRVEQQQPDHWQVFFCRGLIYFNENRKAAALKQLRQALELNEHPEIHYYLGHIYYFNKERNHELAGFHLYKFLLDADSNSNSHSKTLEILKHIANTSNRPEVGYYLGHLYYQKGEYGIARRHLDQFLQGGNINSDWWLDAERLLIQIDGQY